MRTCFKLDISLQHQLLDLEEMGEIAENVGYCINRNIYKRMYIWAPFGAYVYECGYL